MRKKFLFFNILFLCFIILVIGFSFIILTYTKANNKALNVNDSKKADILPIATPKPAIKIADKIQEGLLLLKKTTPLLYEYKIKVGKSGGKTTSGDLLRKQISLAILDTNSESVFEKRVWVYEDNIKNFSETGSMSFQPVDNLEPLNIQPKQWNSFNTFFEIINRPDLIVIADKYFIESTFLGALPERSKNKYTEILYVPYSPALASQDLIETGKKYINNAVDLAFAALENKKVKSAAIPSELITKEIKKEFIKNIILIEHIDPDSFDVSTDSGKELAQRVLTIIGANQENAYRYTGSPAGANGLAQFIKSTYQKITESFPEAKLIKDYNLGMADHNNALQAMVLFFDYYGKEIKDKIARPDITERLGITDEMLAAAYNGGPAKVSKSINEYGSSWLDIQLNLPEGQRIFRDETLNYLRKLRSIKELGIFN